MSKVDLAKACKVSVKTIDAWLVKGVPHTRTTQGHYQFELKAVQRWRAADLLPRAPSAATALPTSYSDARRRKETAIAGLRELQLRKRQDELVEREAVHKVQFTTGRQVRDALMNIPDRLAGVCAAAHDQETIHALLTKEIHQALEALSHEDTHA